MHYEVILNIIYIYETKYSAQCSQDAVAIFRSQYAYLQMKTNYIDFDKHINFLNSDSPNISMLVPLHNTNRSYT